MSTTALERRSEERRVGKECRSRCDWSSDVCSSDLTRSEWQAILEGTDACFAPVLSLDEVPSHEHNRARAAFVDVAGDRQPAPAPRFDRTPAAPPEPASGPGADTAEVLAELG